jgi:hypothetical protein
MHGSCNRVLPSKHTALNSKPQSVLTKKKKKKRNSLGHNSCGRKRKTRSGQKEKQAVVRS